MKRLLHIVKPKQLLIGFLLLFPLVLFFLPVFRGKLPIPADTIVGLYHPYRDVIWNGLTAGVPFKNFLITDAVRQQYPWRQLAIEQVRRGEYPGWNPYTFSGTPLAANLQTALFYPLNLLFFLLPFNLAWTVQVVLQPALLALFSFAYLRELGRSRPASLLFSLALSLGGFSVAWLEWNTTLHTLVWLPLGLLALEKIGKGGRTKWYLALWFSLVCIFLAGFLQTAVYSWLVLFAYSVIKAAGLPEGRRRVIVKLAAVVVLAVITTSIQWLPAAKLISLSGRAYDQGAVLNREDWFLPWQNLVQFIAPDFFGNPATLNYWGVFNYTEFVSYLGMLPLVFALFSLLSFHRLVRAGGFFLAVLLLSLLFVTPNPLAELPFRFGLPFISSAQPSRLLMLVFFSLAFFAAQGLDAYFREVNSGGFSKPVILRLLAALGLVGLALGGMWLYTAGFSSEPVNLAVSRRNLVLPTGLYSAACLLLTAPIFLAKTLSKFPARRLNRILFMMVFILTGFDLLRFAGKFTPFTESGYLYPQTETLKFLQSDPEPFRYLTVDRQIFPPNFSLVYKLSTVEGYDPLYLQRYGQLIASAQKGEPATLPVGFNRIISPDNFRSSVYDVLNVKYILSLTDLDHPKLKKVFEEGQTKVYLNLAVFPRAFVIPDYQLPRDDVEALRQLLSLNKTEIAEAATITRYTENQVAISVDSREGGMLVLADNYYPGWQATVDGRPAEIERVLYNLRGTVIPPGKHEIFYHYSQL